MKWSNAMIATIAVGSVLSFMNCSVRNPVEYERFNTNDKAITVVSIR